MKAYRRRGHHHSFLTAIASRCHHRQNSSCSVPSVTFQQTAIFTFTLDNIDNDSAARISSAHDFSRLRIIATEDAITSLKMSRRRSPRLLRLPSAFILLQHCSPSRLKIRRTARVPRYRHSPSQLTASRCHRRLFPVAYRFEFAGYLYLYRHALSRFRRADAQLTTVIL